MNRDDESCPYYGKLINDLYEFFYKDTEADFECPHCDGAISGSAYTVVDDTLKKKQGAIAAGYEADCALVNAELTTYTAWEN